MVPRTKMHRCHKDDLPVWQTMKKAMEYLKLNWHVKREGLRFHSTCTTVGRMHLRHAFGMELRYVAFYTMLFRPSVSCSTESLLHMQLLLDHPTPCFNIARMARAARAIGKRIPIPRKGLDTQMEPALVPAQATQ